MSDLDELINISNWRIETTYGKYGLELSMRFDETLNINIETAAAELQKLRDDYDKAIADNIELGKLNADLQTAAVEVLEVFSTDLWSAIPWKQESNWTRQSDALKQLRKVVYHE